MVANSLSKHFLLYLGTLLSLPRCTSHSSRNCATNQSAILAWSPAPPRADQLLKKYSYHCVAAGRLREGSCGAQRSNGFCPVSNPSNLGAHPPDENASVRYVRYVIGLSSPEPLTR